MRNRPEFHVMVGVLADADGRVLVAKRPVGKHLAGRWEFPGGKLHEDEAPLAGLKRELAEELGVALESAEPLIRLRHDYPERRVLLDVWRVKRYSGTPSGLDNQALQWAALDDLPNIDLLEADRPIITALRLPPLARCLHGLQALQDAARRSPPEALFWQPGDADPASEETREAVRAARRAGHRVLVTGGGVEAVMMAASSAADGMLLEPTGARLSLDRNGAFITGAICPTPADAEEAARTGVHFLVLASGKSADTRQFSPVFQHLGAPAYIGWYPDAGALEPARAAGAHGCAIGPFLRRPA